MMAPEVAVGTRIVLPALTDTHVHFREPGLTHKATIYSESRAALAGGITGFLDMPNTKPPTVSAAGLTAKYALGAATAQANYGFFPAASAETPELLRTVPRHRIPGIKLFLGTTTGAMAAPEQPVLEEIFRMCAAMDLPVMVHAEDDALIAAATAEAVARHGGSRGAVPVAEHHIIRSREACLRATARAVELAHRFGTHLHIAHVSTADEVREFLSPGPVSGKLVTAETTPLYLIPELSVPSRRTSRQKVNPAIKTEADCAELTAAVLDGRIDTIGTDHAPHLLSEKQGGALTAASGAPSIQFAVPLLLGLFPADVIAEKMGVNPRLIFHISGTLRQDGNTDNASNPLEGSCCTVEKCEPYAIGDSDVLSTCGWTPFAGLTASWRVVETRLNGRLAYARTADGESHFFPAEAEELCFG